MQEKILFVDDSPVMKKIVKRSVENLNYGFLEAGNGKEALNVLAGEPDIKLIFSDWNMPEMNGFDFLVAVKSNNTYKNIPVIMITTESEKSNINKALQAGAASYLLKPVNNEEFVKKITKYIGVKK